MLGNFHCRGVLMIRIIVRQGPTVLTIVTGWACLAIFFHVLFLFLSPSLKDGSK